METGFIWVSTGKLLGGLAWFMWNSLVTAKNIFLAFAIMSSFVCFFLSSIYLSVFYFSFYLSVLKKVTFEGNTLQSCITSLKNVTQLKVTCCLVSFLGKVACIVTFA